MTQVDIEAQNVVMKYLLADPDGSRTGGVIRRTFDQIYDGQHTGRYRLEELSKTEKTHIGSLIEINLRRELADLFEDGVLLDYRVGGIDLDCKFSIKFGGWMVPPEAVGKLLLVCTANDEKSEWAIGVVRATEDRLTPGGNRDSKRQLSAASRGEILWIFDGEDLPENTLLHINQEDAKRIMSGRSGQQRINQLLRTVTNRRIGRGTVATVAQQDDYMKRLRESGGAKSHLSAEGILVIGGTYAAHRAVARDLGAVVPERGETVSLRVVHAEAGSLDSVFLDDRWWRLANENELASAPAPHLPKISRIAISP